MDFCTKFHGNLSALKCFHPNQGRVPAKQDCYLSPQKRKMAAYVFSLLAQNYIYTQVLIAKLEFVCLLHSSNKPATQIHTCFFRTSTDPSPSNQQYSVIHQRRAAASLSIINRAKGSPCDLSGVFLHTLALILIKNTQANDDVCACTCECVYPHILTKARSFAFLRADDIRCSYSFSLGLRLNSP